MRITTCNAIYFSFSVFVSCYIGYIAGNSWCGFGIAMGCLICKLYFWDMPNKDLGCKPIIWKELNKELRYWTTGAMIGAALSWLLRKL